MAADDRQRVIAALRSTVEATCIRLAVNTHAELVERTPRDTGWAKANWIPSLTAPVATLAGSPEGVSTADSEAGLAAVLAFKLESGAIFVANNVPYIRRLDAGSSTQAPAGFVRQAIDKALADEAAP